MLWALKTTMQLDPLKTSSYDFTLPEELIATHPVEPRDHARLLVYDRATDTITHSRFDKLETFLPENCGIIFNDTKVIKARLYGTKSSGGKVELLINELATERDALTNNSQRVSEALKGVGAASITTLKTSCWGIG